MKTVMETIAEITEPLIKAADMSTREAIKLAAIDGYTAGIRDARNLYSESLEQEDRNVKY